MDLPTATIESIGTAYLWNLILERAHEACCHSARELRQRQLSSSTRVPEHAMVMISTVRNRPDSLSVDRSLSFEDESHFECSSSLRSCQNHLIMTKGDRSDARLCGYQDQRSVGSYLASMLSAFPFAFLSGSRTDALPLPELLIEHDIPSTLCLATDGLGSLESEILSQPDPQLLVISPIPARANSP